MFSPIFGNLYINNLHDACRRYGRQDRSHDLSSLLSYTNTGRRLRRPHHLTKVFYSLPSIIHSRTGVVPEFFQAPQQSMHMSPQKEALRIWPEAWFSYHFHARLLIRKTFLTGQVPSEVQLPGSENAQSSFQTTDLAACGLCCLPRHYLLRWQYHEDKFKLEQLDCRLNVQYVMTRIQRYRYVVHG